MPKNIVICCDGTGNDFDNADTDSNVVKLYRCLTIDRNQVAYYHPGVGTMGDPTRRFWIGRQWSRIRGLAFGAGLKANVADAYRYLMNTYEDGDRIFLIGFSRGAYTVRVLAGLIHMFGLACAGNEGLIPYIMRLFSKWSRASNYKIPTATTDEAFKWGFSHSDVNIHFCGLWDTVSSYGWIYKPIKLPFEGNNPIIRTGRQAISIHERRCFYSDRLWATPGGGSTQNIRQVWFAGVHSDVGGSYPEQECGLSKLSLEWILVEAQNCGLRLNCDNVDIVLGRKPAAPAIPFVPAYQPPDNNAKLHKSLRHFWWIPEFWPQRNPHQTSRYYIPLGRGRTIPPGSILHQSTVTGSYMPCKLPTAWSCEPWVPWICLCPTASPPTPTPSAIATASTPTVTEC
jgi:hypothetical protein